MDAGVARRECHLSWRASGGEKPIVSLQCWLVEDKAGGPARMSTESGECRGGGPVRRIGKGLGGSGALVGPCEP
jgi:hypothetical protein